MTRLSLSFLGTFQVVLDDKVVRGFRSSNVQGLLVYLALQANQPFARDSLATLFWPEQSDSTARKNLRQTLYQLRKVLDDSDKNEQSFLLVSRQSIQFNPQSNFVLDVAQFLAALDEGDLTTAVSHYTADLLLGFTCDSLEFEEWLRGERERLHGLALRTMERLAARYLRNGRVEAAAAIARQQLTLEAWSETAHQQLMEALALAGNRTAALAQLEQCQAILDEELGISPSPETLALAERIQNNELRPIDPDLIAGRYVLAEEIGRGAMGIVYRGRDNQTGGAVAIKVLDTAKVNQQPELVARFLREGEALQQLNHPNIVKMRAMAEKDGRYYLVMDYIAGGDLQHLLTREPQLAYKRAITITLDLADALTRTHRLGILHRDLKPANVLLDDNGLPRLTDFGIARLGEESELTEHGAILGTLAYLSPEACMGETLDERSDIWSLGVMLYEMLVGERPFTSPTAHATFHAILSNPLPDIRLTRPDIPDALEDLLYRMLTKNRAGRLPSVRLVGAELEAILREAPLPTTSTSPTPPPEPGPALRQTFVTPTPERLARHNLPNQTTPFVGREAELTELARLLADASTQLVTILGPGGMGKTRLSLELAGRLVASTSATQVAFPDGAIFVELAAVNSVEQMLTAVATALGFAIEKELEPIQQIINYLSNKQLMLLLDNFEHLLAPPLNGADVITAVLQATSNVKIIVTTRQRLNLSSETVFTLEGLGIPDWETPDDALSYSAVQLFVQSVRRVQVDFALTAENLPFVTRICRLTEGMPLGIVLAAAWIELLSLAEIADEMQADIDFLESEMGDLPPRQRSMRAVFDYSWALLSPPEQAVLAKLSIFKGGFTREAAQAVTGATLRQLLGLVNKSLVHRDAGNGRFSLHELLRQLAAKKLETQGKTEAIRTAHSRYYLSWAASLEAASQTSQQLEVITVLRRDEQNTLASWLWAAQQGEAALLLSVLPVISFYLLATGSDFEAMRLFQQTLQQLPPGDSTFTDTTDKITLIRASILNRLQDLGFETFEGQPIDIDRLHAYFQACGARLEEALACQHLGYRAMREPNFPQALAYFQRQVDIYEQENEVLRLPLSLGRLSMLMLFAGQIEVAFKLSQRATEISKQASPLFQSAAAFILTMYKLFEENDYAAAQASIAEITAAAHKSWLAGYGAINVLGGLILQGYIALLQGKLDEAQQIRQKAVEIATITNNPRHTERAEAFASLIRLTLGEYQTVQVQIFASREGGLLSIGAIGTALTAYGQGNIPLAVMTIIQNWSTPIATRWLNILLQFMPIVVALVADKGDHARAASLLAMGWAHPSCPRGWWEIMALVQDLEARLQAALSPEVYAAAQARGQEMDVRETAVSLLEELKGMQS